MSSLKFLNGLVECDVLFVLIKLNVYDEELNIPVVCSPLINIIDLPDPDYDTGLRQL